MKNYLPLYLFCIIFGWLSTTQAQQISGKVTDSKNQAIPFATIQIGKNYGVITNEEGNFSIDTKNYKPTDTVTISCLGYDQNKILLQNFTTKNYLLNEKLNELDEIYLTNKKLSIDSIIYYVKTNLKKNYQYNNSEFEIFSRKTEFVNGKNADFKIKKSTGFRKKQLAAFNHDFDKLEQSLVNNKSKQYTDFVGSLKLLNLGKKKLEVKKAIRLLDKNNSQSLETLAKKGQEIVMKHLDKDKYYKVKSGLFKISDSVSLKEGEKKMGDTINSLAPVKNYVSWLVTSNNFANEKTKLDFVTNIKKYTYKLKDITFLNNEMVYIIDFKPKRSGAKYAGTMYVSSDTFAVLRTNFSFFENRVGEKFNLKLLLGVKFVENERTGVVVFKKEQNNYYYPSYISLNKSSYFYIDRPIKFIENNTSNKVSFNFKIEGEFHEKHELLILSRNELSTANFNAFKEAKNIDYEEPKKYDASIWENYNVIEPLNDMKNFNVE